MVTFASTPAEERNARAAASADPAVFQLTIATSTEGLPDEGGSELSGAR